MTARFLSTNEARVGLTRLMALVLSVRVHAGKYLSSYAHYRHERGNNIVLDALTGKGFPIP